MIKKQPGVDVVRQVHNEFQAALLNCHAGFELVDSLVLIVATLAVAMLDEHKLAWHFEYFGGGARHEVEPIGVLGRRTVMRASELGDVERVVVAIDDEWHVGHIALVESIACDAALCGPAAEVASAIAEPVG